MRPTLKIIALVLSGTVCLITSVAALAQSVPAAPATSTDIVPCRIVEAVKPHYPARMLHAGVTRGTVHMLLYVDSTGKLSDTLLTAYSRRPFADEAATVVKRWKFIPATDKGQPRDTIVDLTFDFEVNGVVVVQNFEVDRMSGGDQFRDFEYQPAYVQQLDRVPTPLNIVEPTYPREWMKQGIVGRVTVNFYIDETGLVRFPIAAPGANEQLVGIALAAVEQWRFIPPKVKDRPVLVHAQQVFEFSADEKP